MRLTPNASLAKFILAILNSKLSDWLFRKTSTNNHCNMYELIELPIPTASKSQQQLIIALVDKIICAKKADRMSDTSKLESEIDRRIYQLYELCEDEIKIIERKWY